MNLLQKSLLIGVGSLGFSTMSKNNLTDKVENKKDFLLNKEQFPYTTILLPTLNEEWMIEKTLQSIINQNIYVQYPEKFELLIVDSESTDNTLNIARRYLTNKDKILSLPVRDLVIARTYGIANSLGELIVFIDADTIYPINWLNYMLKQYYYDKSLIAISGPEIHPNTGKIREIFEPILINTGIKKNNEMIGHNASCYKWAFNAINGFEVSFKYDIHSSEDTQIVLERNFANKLKTIGKYKYDTQLLVFDYGLLRRIWYNDRQNICKTMNTDNKYLCAYWNEREKGIRF